MIRVSSRPRFTELWFELVFLGGGLLWLAAVYLFGYQIFLYLKHGAWESISVIDGLIRFNKKTPSLWLLYPQDWIGLHELLEKIPMTFGLIILSVIWFICAGYVGVKLEELETTIRQKWHNEEEV
jgi:hypothetical protein